MTQEMFQCPYTINLVCVCCKIVFKLVQIIGRAANPIIDYTTNNKSGNGQTIYKVLNMKMISISIHHQTTTDGQHGFATIPLKYPLLTQPAALLPFMDSIDY